MNVVVTGGAGFIGSHLTELLLEKGHSVKVIDVSRDNIQRNIKPHEALKVFEKDINDPKTAAIYKNADWVVHLAALADVVPSIKDPIKYHETNVNGTLRVLNYAMENNVKRFIYSASSSCYGDKPPVPTSEDAKINPQYPYAYTKWMGEEYVKMFDKVYGLPTLSLRLFNVYGPRSRTSGAYGAVFGVFLTQKAHNKPVTVVGDGYQGRDFVYVKDVCEAFLLALESEHRGYSINIGAGAHRTVRELCHHLGCFNLDFIPDRPGEPRITLADLRQSYSLLKWRPKTDFKQGVRTMLDLVEQYRDAPLWDKKSIEKATEDWFKYMGDKNESKLSGSGKRL